MNISNMYLKQNFMNQYTKENNEKKGRTKHAYAESFYAILFLQSMKKQYSHRLFTYLCVPVSFLFTVYNLSSMNFE